MRRRSRSPSIVFRRSTRGVILMSQGPAHPSHAPAPKPVPSPSPAPNPTPTSGASSSTSTLVPLTTQIVGDKINMYVVFDALAGAIYTYDAKLNTFGTRCPLAEVKPPPESPTPSTPPAPPEPPAPPVDSDPVAAAAAASATAAAASATAAAASAA